jgi:hypothetical protein
MLIPLKENIATQFGYALFGGGGALMNEFLANEKQRKRSFNGFL